VESVVVVVVCSCEMKEDIYRNYNRILFRQELMFKLTCFSDSGLAAY
jgi:hypothetical protein